MAWTAPPEPLWALSAVVRAADEIMEEPVTGGTLRAFTMRLSEHPSPELAAELTRTAHANGFSFHMGEPVRRYNAKRELVYCYTPVWFLNHAS